MVYLHSVSYQIKNLLSKINIIFILYVRICVFFKFPAGCVSHRDGGEGQADASKAVQGESEEDER